MENTKNQLQQSFTQVKLLQSLAKGAPLNTFISIHQEIDRFFLYGEASNKIKCIHTLLNFWLANGGLKELEGMADKNAATNLIFNITQTVEFLAATGETWMRYSEANQELLDVVNNFKIPEA